MKTRICLIISVFLLAINFSFAQHFEWSTSGGYVGVPNAFSGAIDIARDPAGNLYIYNDGNLAQQCQGDTIQTVTSTILLNSFVHKFNSAGQLQWIKAIGPQFDPFSIEADEQGQVYLLGRNGSNNQIIMSDTTLTVPLATNFILKFSTDGDFIWLHNTGMTSTGGLGKTGLLHYHSGKLYFQNGGLSAGSIDTAGNFLGNLTAAFYQPQTAFLNIWLKSGATFSNGDLLIVGEHRGRLAFGNDTLPLDATAAGLERYFFLRVTPSMQLVWYKSYGSFYSTSQFPIGIAIDNNDNAYASVLLNFNTPIVFGPDSVFNSTLGNGMGGYIKMDGSGNPLWMKTIQSGQTTNPYGMVWSHDNTGVVACGVYGGVTNFGNITINGVNDGKGYIAKFDTAGNFIYAYSAATPGVIPNALQSFAYAIASDGNGKYYVSGKLNTNDPYIQSCITYSRNRGFFLSSFTGIPDTIPNPSIVQNGNLLTATPPFTGDIQWLLNGTPIPGANGQTYTATQNGNYSVIYEYNFGCVGSDTSDVEFITVSSIMDDQSTVFSSHPNPFSAELTIDSGNEFIHSYSVYSADGRVVVAATGVHTNRLTFETEKWESGIYFVRLTAERSSATIKILKVQ